MKKVAVVIPARNEEASLPSLLEGIFASVPAGYKLQVVLAVNNSTPEFERWADYLAERDARTHTLQLGQLYPRTFAYAYLCGLRYAAEELQADYVVEMDAGGSFDPRDLPRFLRMLETADAAFSTRFSHGGRMVRPLQRKLVSFFGTVLANLVLGLGRVIPDMTSGYEAFRGEILRNLFGLVPPEKWVSANFGPGHFYQTEMRTRICWMALANQKIRLASLSIVMGAGKVREPQKLPPKTLLQAFESLIRLRKERKNFIERAGSRI